MYQLGQRARKAVEEARQQVAGLIGAEDPDEIIFTSGATESNNMALKGVRAESPQGRRIVSTAIEHSSVRTVLQSLGDKGQIDNVVVPVQSNGCVDLSDIKEALGADTILVSAIAVNNENWDGATHPRDSPSLQRKRTSLFTPTRFRPLEK